MPPETHGRRATADLRVGCFRLQVLVAEDPSTVDEKTGYSDATVSMLYQVHVLGKSAFLLAEIRAWIAAETSTAVLAIESREATGAHFFDGYL